VAVMPVTQTRRSRAAAPGLEPAPIASRPPCEDKRDSITEEASMTLFKSVAALAAVFAAPFCAPAHAMDYEIARASCATPRSRWSGSSPLLRRRNRRRQGRQCRGAQSERLRDRGCRLRARRLDRMARHGDSAFQIVPHPRGRRGGRRRHPRGQPRRLLLGVQRQGIRDLKRPPGHRQRRGFPAARWISWARSSLPRPMFSTYVRTRPCPGRKLPLDLPCRRSNIRRQGESRANVRRTGL